MMIHDTTGQKNKLEWTFQIWNLKHRKVRWTYRLQECRDPSAERPVYVCTYMFIVYRSILLYILLLSWILYMFVFHYEICKVFINALKWISFLEDETFWCAKFFCDPIISHVLKRSQDRMHFKSSCSLLCVYRVQWGYYLCLKMQWCCDDSSTLPLDALTERCPSKTSSILSHVSRFKTKTRWILNYSAGLSTLRHFKSPSTSFNPSRSVAGQRQGQRFFQWSDFCRGQFVSFWLWFRFMIKLMSHVRQWEHRSGFIGDFYYYDVGLLFSSAYGFVFFSVCLHLHQKRH